MSICINNDLIWVSIPRSASTSIENKLFQSGIPIKHYVFDSLNAKGFQHVHVQLFDLYDRFGKKESVCIRRDFFDRWLSAIQHLFYMYDYNNIETIVKWEDVDNDFIYEHLTKDYIDKLYSLTPFIKTDAEGELKNHAINELSDLIRHFMKHKDEPIDTNFTPYKLLASPLYWTNNQKCTYEFDMNDISSFEKFISNRYGVEFKLEKENQSKYPTSKIVKDDKLKNWVFDNFEKRFHLPKKLI